MPVDLSRITMGRIDPSQITSKVIAGVECVPGGLLVTYADDSTEFFAGLY